MSREIKCRAWHRGLREWHYFNSIDELWATAKKGTWDFWDYKNWCEATGLKDKNGKEIFNGDILKSQDGILKVEIDFRSGGCNQFPLSGQYRSCGFYLPEPCEIIGTIYENPELVK